MSITDFTFINVKNDKPIRQKLAAQIWSAVMCFEFRTDLRAKFLYLAANGPGVRSLCPIAYSFEKLYVPIETQDLSSIAVMQQCSV